jgi:hypothetical protein
MPAGEGARSGGARWSASVRMEAWEGRSRRRLLGWRSMQALVTPAAAVHLVAQLGRRLRDGREGPKRVGEEGRGPG